MKCLLCVSHCDKHWVWAAAQNWGGCVSRCLGDQKGSKMFSILVSKKVTEKLENDIYCIIKSVLLGLCSSSKTSSQSVNMACNECSPKKNIWTGSKILKIPMEVLTFEKHFRPCIQEVVMFILFYFHRCCPIWNHSIHKYVWVSTIVSDIMSTIMYETQCLATESTL